MSKKIDLEITERDVKGDDLHLTLQAALLDTAETPPVRLLGVVIKTRFHLEDVVEQEEAVDPTGTFKQQLVLRLRELVAASIYRAPFQVEALHEENSFTDFLMVDLREEVQACADRLEAERQKAAAEHSQRDAKAAKLAHQDKLGAYRDAETLARQRDEILILHADVSRLKNGSNSLRLKDFLARLVSYADHPLVPEMVEFLIASDHLAKAFIDNFSFYKEGAFAQSLFTMAALKEPQQALQFFLPDDRDSFARESWAEEVLEQIAQEHPAVLFEQMAKLEFQPFAQRLARLAAPLAPEAALEHQQHYRLQPWADSVRQIAELALEQKSLQAEADAIQAAEEAERQKAAEDARRAKEKKARKKAADRAKAKKKAEKEARDRKNLAELPQKAIQLFGECADFLQSSTKMTRAFERRLKTLFNTLNRVVLDQCIGNQPGVEVAAMEFVDALKNTPLKHNEAVFGALATLFFGRIDGVNRAIVWLSDFVERLAHIFPVQATYHYQSYASVNQSEGILKRAATECPLAFLMWRLESDDDYDFSHIASELGLEADGYLETVQLVQRLSAKASLSQLAYCLSYFAQSGYALPIVKRYFEAQTSDENRKTLFHHCSSEFSESSWFTGFLIFLCQEHPDFFVHYARPYVKHDFVRKMLKNLAQRHDDVGRIAKAIRSDTVMDRTLAAWMDFWP